MLLFCYFQDSDSGSSSNVEDEPPVSDEVKLQRINEERSRSSTVEEEEKRGFDKTVQESSFDEPQMKTDGLAEQIYFVPEPLYASDDEEETFRPFVRERSPTMTTGSEPSTKEYKNEVQVSWKDIPDQNTEDERDHWILYVQRNSGMMFAGMVEESLITDDYIKTLVSSERKTNEKEKEIVGVLCFLVELNYIQICGVGHGNSSDSIDQ